MAVRLDDIDYFLAVASHGQVRRAAAALGLSQPAITKGLQRLEKELGFPLFERGARGMTLTPVAEQFRQRTQTLRASLGDAIKEAADLHLGAMGLLRVGVSPLYAQRLFVPACLQLHRQRPAARMRVMINLNDALLTALRLGDLDLTINALPGVVPDDLEAVPLMSDDLCMVVREGHPLLSRRRVRLQDLVDAQWMLPGPGVSGRRGVEARLSEGGLPPPRVAVEVSTTAGQLSRLLVHSDLVSIMSETSLAGPGGEGLVPPPFAEARFTRAIGAVTLRDHALPPLARRFLEILRDGDRETPAPTR
jgi:DNA-binding transcriptional LysR family regulator